MKVKLTLALFLSFCMNLFAQGEYTFSQLTVENGLSQISVTSIFQDSNGLMWFGTRNGLNSYDGYQFDVYQSQATDSTTISDNHIYAIVEDANKDLWIGTNNGLNRYNAQQDTFTRYFVDSKITNNLIAALCVDQDQRLWIGTTKGLYLYSAESDNFKHFLLDDQLTGNTINSLQSFDNKLYVGTSNKGVIICSIHQQELTVEEVINSSTVQMESNDIRALYVEQNGDLWIGTHHSGVYFKTKEESAIKVYNQSNGLTNNHVRSFSKSPEGKILVGTFNGFNIIDADGIIEQYQSSKGKEGSLSHYSVYATYYSRDKTLWVGTYGGGINYYNPLGQRFHFYNPASQLDNMLGIVGPIVETLTDLYIATEGGGLLQYNKSTGNYQQHKIIRGKVDEHSKNILKALYLDGNKILCGTNQGTIFEFDLRTKQFRKFYDSNTLNSIYQIGRLKSGHLFVIGVNQIGLKIFDDKLRPVDSFKLQSGEYFQFNDVRTFLEINDNEFVLGTRSNGLFYLDAVKGVLKQYKKEHDKLSLPESYISALHKESANTIWIGTFGGGLCLLNLDNSKVKIFNKNSGLADDNVCSIVEDDRGQLWVSTSSGITQIDSESRELKTYTHANGIAVDEFTPHVGAKLMNGQITFSGNNGYVIFDPRRMWVNPTIPNIILKNLYVNNYIERVHGGNDILTENFYTSSKITLKHNQSNIGIEYSALNYILSGKNQYKYYLEGYENTWNEVGTRRIAYYTNIPPGEYTFYVKGANNDGVWNQESRALKIEVLPPFWKTWWAYLGYFVLTISILYFIIRSYDERRQLKNNIKLEQARAEGQKEFHEARSRLFTNFSHELRTPLTLILSPLGELLKNETSQNGEVHTRLKMMYNNALRMLRLVNNLMSFQKNESGSLEVNLVNTDFNEFANDIVQLFNELAISRDITYTYTAEKIGDSILFDPTLLEKVFINILSNAFKNTDAGGEVSLKSHILSAKEVENKYSQRVDSKVADNFILVQIIDSGEGIDPHALESIFTPFYQVAQNKHSSSGTGLGLSISKSVVELHQGALWAENNVDKGACFSFIIPVLIDPNRESVYQEKETDNALRNIEQYVEVENTPNGKKYPHTLLLIDDNYNIRTYLSTLFSANYNIIVANDGAEGIEKAKETMPDLIITDWMMPNMSGLEMAAILKSDILTSHIPIVMLTAKAMTDSILEGYKTGVDAYVTKPFDAELLTAKVEAMIKERQILKTHYAKQFTLLKEHNEVNNSLDEEFIQKIYQLLDDNISNIDFDINELSKEMNMSRSSFYRKLKSLTELSPSEFIRNFRLEMAAKLLANASLSVSDVYVAVGFNSIAYFSSSFKSYFGVSPSEYSDKQSDVNK